MSSMVKAFAFGELVNSHFFSYSEICGPFKLDGRVFFFMVTSSCVLLLDSSILHKPLCLSLLPAKSGPRPPAGGEKVGIAFDSIKDGFPIKT